MRQKPVICTVIPSGVIPTMVSTSAEKNSDTGIASRAWNLKLRRVFGETHYPRFALLNPRRTLTLPRYQRPAASTSWAIFPNSLSPTRTIKPATTSLRT